MKAEEDRERWPRQDGFCVAREQLGQGRALTARTQHISECTATGLQWARAVDAEAGPG